MRRNGFGQILKGDPAEECTLLFFIDDAKGKLTAGKFISAKTTEAYQIILEEHLMRYGRPLALYVDKHSIFRTSLENAKESEIHFARVLRDLGRELICAHSPPKGRIERANEILQDRFIKELRLLKISTMKEANWG